MERVEIGPVPPEEECQQVGTHGYSSTIARKECVAYIGLLRRTLGPEPQGAKLRITANPHDFGTYLDVVCDVEEDNQEAWDYALQCEGSGPTNWDDEARKELNL